MRRLLVRMATTVTFVIALVGAGVLPATAVGQPAAQPAGQLAEDVPPALENPAPVGANDFDCKPSARHPRPVVLVHGLGASAATNFGAFSPALKAQGYCVFALTYGTTALPVVGGLRPLEQSAEQLNMFVDKVRAATGSSTVDLVGHSEGGTMPRYYLKNLGGAEEVTNFVAWAPPNHGTTLNGINKLADALPGVADLLVPPLCASCLQLLTGSEFIDELNAGDETVGDVRHTVLTTRYDFVVTPHTSGYLKGDNVENITVQDVNPLDFAEHVGMAFDPTTYRLTFKALAKN